MVTWEGVDDATTRLRNFIAVNRDLPTEEQVPATITFAEGFLGLTRESQEQVLINISEVIGLGPGSVEGTWCYFGFLLGLAAVQADRNAALVDESCD